MDASFETQKSFCHSSCSIVTLPWWERNGEVKGVVENGDVDRFMFQTETCSYFVVFSRMKLFQVGATCF